jgi:hypothetical protein
MAANHDVEDSTCQVFPVDMPITAELESKNFDKIMDDKIIFNSRMREEFFMILSKMILSKISPVRVLY